MSWRSFGEDYAAVQSGPGACLFIHSLARPGRNISKSTQRGTRPSRGNAEQVDTDMHKQSRLLGGGWLFVAGLAGVRASGPHRQGELIRKWQRESEVGFCTDTSRIGMSLHSDSAFKFAFMSFEANLKPA